MSIEHRCVAVASLLAVIGLITAGCGSNEPSKADGTSTTVTQEQTLHAQAVKFAECMRRSGYAEFPDPGPSGDWEAFGISVSPEVWVSALTACKDLQPPGSFSADMTPEELSAAVKFARCVREHGVKDFPDPVNGEPLVDTTKIPSTNTPEGMTTLNAAMETCGDLAEEAIGDR